MQHCAGFFTFIKEIILILIIPLLVDFDSNVLLTFSSRELAF
jgi:hypothetical protein